MNSSIGRTVIIMKVWQCCAQYFIAITSFIAPYCHYKGAIKTTLGKEPSTLIWEFDKFSSWWIIIQAHAGPNFLAFLGLELSIWGNQGDYVIVFSAHAVLMMSLSFHFGLDFLVMFLMLHEYPQTFKLHTFVVHSSRSRVIIISDSVYKQRN